MSPAPLGALLGLIILSPAAVAMMGRMLFDGRSLAESRSELW